MLVSHHLVHPGQAGNSPTDSHSQNCILGDADPGTFGG